MKSNKKLIVVADDFGLTQGVNNGILKGYSDGIVTEISLMLDFPATDHAIDIIKKNSISNVGIHLLLQGFNKEKKMLRHNDYITIFKNKSHEEVKHMAEVELNLFEREIGKKPTHIIPQYGIHGNLKLLSFLIEYSKKLKIPMRIPRTVLAGGFGENYAAEIMMRRSGVVSTDYLFVHTDGYDIEAIKDMFLNELKTVGNNQTAEIVTHPAYFDNDLLKMSSLNFERSRDLAMVLDPVFKNRIEKMNFKFISYSDLEE